MPHPGAVLAALADRDRARVHAALVLAGEADLDGLVSATGLAPAAVRRAAARLVAAGLAVADGGAEGVERWRHDPAGLAEAAKLASRLVVAPDAGDGAASPEHAAVLRAYLVDGRLRAIPAVRHKRLVVLDWLSQQFEPGKAYPEAEVNRIIARVHPDYATLRRAMVDDDLMTRREGFYWRSGGTFDV